MSIRLQILLPLFLLVAGALAMAGLIGRQAIEGHQRVQDTVAMAMNARELSTEIGEQFRASTAVLDHVLAMTTFVSVGEVKARFAEADEATSVSLASLGAVKLSPAVSNSVTTLSANYQGWRKSARVALGLDDAKVVPTAEALARGDTAVMGAIADVQKLVATSANESISAAGDALAATIRAETMLAAGVSAVVLLVMLLLANLISRPIGLVTKAMQSLAHGNHDLALPASRSSPEIRAMIGALTVFRDNARDRDRMKAETRDAEQMKLGRAEAKALHRLLSRLLPLLERPSPSMPIR